MATFDVLLQPGSRSNVEKAGICDGIPRKVDKDLESIQSSTTPVPGYHMGK